MTEIGFTSTEIAHLDSNLDQWARPERVRLQLTMRPGSAFVSPEPKGVVLVIGAVELSRAADAGPARRSSGGRQHGGGQALRGGAGRRALLAETFPSISTNGSCRRRGRRRRDDGAARTSSSTTSSTRATAPSAAIVMRAAAEHLTPVTLELGGKSPAIVAADANLDAPRTRIAWGKFTNAGQTCVAPDYVLVHRDAEDQLLGDLLRAIHDFYGNDPHSSPDYGRIVNDRHFDRLVDLLDGGGLRGGRHRRRLQARRPLHRADRARRRATRLGRDGRRDLRADPSRHRRRRSRRGDPLRQRPAQAARPLRVLRAPADRRARRRAHVVRRRHDQPRR